MCGEQSTPSVSSFMTAGSSPRVRGAGGRCTGGQAHIGIIPACAGSSRRYSIVVLFVMGSSPRVRGAVMDAGEFGAIAGIIPACAGSSTSLPLIRFRSSGSSPRVRGAERIEIIESKQRGIIPACAGSSYRCANAPLCGGDHPRVCGEQPQMPAMPFTLSGSSPRVRGAVFPSVWQDVVRGIIPACAGSSRRRCARR